MSRPQESQVFGKKAPSRQTCGRHETAGGHELCTGLRVCLYEEYVATIHEQPQSMGAIKRAGLVGGTVKRVLPGGFAAEVLWDNGQRGTYFQSVLFTGDEVPKEPMPAEYAPNREVAEPPPKPWFDLQAVESLWGDAMQGLANLTGGKPSPRGER